MLVRKAETKLATSLKEMIQKKEAKDVQSRPTVLVCDCSGSMSDMAKTATKIAILAKTVNTLQTQFSNIKIIRFSSSAQLVSELHPSASGGTALHKALDLAVSLRPAKVIVLSDGIPDNEDAALRSASKLSCPISCIYIGPEGGFGWEFLKRLATGKGGQFSDVNLSQESQLESKIRKMLSA